MSTCKKCTSTINKKSPGLFCAGECRSFYHARCVQLATAVLPALTTPGSFWKCPDCRDAVDAFTIISEEVEDEDINIGAILKGIRTELSALNNKYDAIVQSVTFCTNKIVDFEQSLKALDDKCKAIDVVVDENAHLKSDVSKLNKVIDDLEQRSRLYNIEIQGVPHVANENLLKILEDIGGIIKFPITKNDVDVVHRVAHMNKSTSPRNIVVKLFSRRKRDEVLAAVRIARKANIDKPGIYMANSRNQIFINEHLTPKNKLLYKKLREVATAKKFKYHWVKHGIMHARRDDTSKIITVACEEDLKRII
ncbi:Baculovirus FP protein [Popillia japonica]|uniref:Baculovirus FP protein n=1 Tax=Popillia japonica TaxID=7064 RepID=A0AAW1JGK3_POPJA